MYRKTLIFSILTCVTLLLAESILLVYFINDNHNNLLEYREIERKAKDLPLLYKNVLVPERNNNHEDHFVFIHKVKTRNEVTIRVEKLPKINGTKQLNTKPSPALYRILFQESEIEDQGIY